MFELYVHEHVYNTLCYDFEGASLVLPMSDMLRNIDVNMLTIIGTNLVMSKPNKITSTEIYLCVST